MQPSVMRSVQLIRQYRRASVPETARHPALSSRSGVYHSGPLQKPDINPAHSGETTEEASPKERE